MAAGSQNTQFKLQTLASNVSPSRHGGSYTVDKTIGPSGKYYFIRMEGSQRDSSGNPVMAFSARFELKGMSGQFNSTVLSAATGAEGPASGSSSSAASSGSMSTAVNQATQTATTPSSQATNNTATNNKSSSAGRLSTVNVASIVGSLAVAAFGVVALI